MARIGVVVVDIHSDADHPDAITIIEGIERMVEEITADVSYILLEYAPEEAHPHLTTLLPDATVFPKSFQDPFLDAPFVRHLQQEDIRAVVAVGYDARRCVKSGVQSALKHNFHVITSPNMMTSYDCDFAIDSSLFNEPELACLNEQLKLGYQQSIKPYYEDTVSLASVANLISYINSLDPNILPPPQFPKQSIKSYLMSKLISKII